MTNSRNRPLVCWWRVPRSDVDRCLGPYHLLRTYNYHRGHTALGGQPMCPTCQVRTSLPRAPTGVMLLLLSPSASPERVRLSAAELAERLLAPRIPMSTRCSRDGMQIRLIPSISPSSGGTSSRPPKRVPVGCRPGDRRPSEKEPSQRCRGNRCRAPGSMALPRCAEGRADQAGATPNPLGVKPMTPSNADPGNPPPNIYTEIR